MTNALFAQTNKDFKDACEYVGLPNTTRQASKFRSDKGLAKKKWPGRIVFVAWKWQQMFDAAEV